MKCLLRFSLGVTLVATLQACALSTSPDYDSRFGDATRALQAQQLMDPGAPLRHGDAQGRMDGRSAREAHERYVQSFGTPPQSSVINSGAGAAK
jgi:hypothetical protein